MSDSNKTPYNDRALTEGSDDVLPKPQIDIIVDGNRVFKPGMKTFFVDEYDTDDEEYVGKVMGEYCSCDTVTSTHVVCTCLSVCTCESVCSCLTYQKPTSTNSGTGTRTVSCGSPCACVPVH